MAATQQERESRPVRSRCQGGGTWPEGRCRIRPPAARAPRAARAGGPPLSRTERPLVAVALDAAVEEVVRAGRLAGPDLVPAAHLLRSALAQARLAVRPGH